jgi:DNA phosphorothioation-associated putative methyltransferase
MAKVISLGIKKKEPQPELAQLNTMMLIGNSTKGLRHVEPSKKFDQTFKSEKTALHRKGASNPLKTSINAGIIKAGDNVMDFGCGHGKDVEHLSAEGFTANGYDRFYYPDNFTNETANWNIALCFYVLNVLPTIQERQAVLQEIYDMLPKGGRVLIAVRSQKEVDYAAQRSKWLVYRDGYISKVAKTGNQFQTGFTQYELDKFTQSVGFKTVDVSLKISGCTFTMGVK